MWFEQFFVVVALCALVLVMGALHWAVVRLEEWRNGRRSPDWCKENRGAARW